MKQLIFLIFLINYSLAYEFKLNKKDLTYIDNSSRKSFILNRLTKYENMKSEIKDYELIKKLSYVNTFMNKTFSANDTSTQSTIASSKVEASRSIRTSPLEVLITILAAFLSGNKVIITSASKIPS